MERAPDVRFVPAGEDLCLLDVRIRRDRGGYVVAARAPARMNVRVVTASWIYWMHHASEDVREILCDCSDGDEPSLAPFVYSSFDPARVLVPDGHFFRYQGYREMRALAEKNPVAWSERSDEIVWRGLPNGKGMFTMAPGLQTHPVVNQRLRLAIRARDSDLGVDFRFVAKRPRIDPFLRPHGLIGERIPTESWLGRKFAIDIDGHSNTWDNMMVRLHQGCCLLKVAGKIGFRQWYYDRLEPWRHFVPIKADLSDLAERLDWVRSHDDRAREIAAEGQALARSMTWEGERAVAAALIEQHGERA